MVHLLLLLEVLAVGFVLEFFPLLDLLSNDLAVLPQPLGLLLLEQPSTLLLQMSPL